MAVPVGGIPTGPELASDDGDTMGCDAGADDSADASADEAAEAAAADVSGLGEPACDGAGDCDGTGG